ncbi:hypothetical protein KAR91_01985 [Candidatus Pacearchaeota archaeon]|nr:hypothetical protein [Candidatus Pacearchaeota archaeon]
MASKADRSAIDSYSFNRPLQTFGVAFDLMFPTHEADTREEDKQEGRQKPEKRRDDE